MLLASITPTVIKKYSRTITEFNTVDRNSDRKLDAFTNEFRSYFSLDLENAQMLTGIDFKEEFMY